MMQLFYLIAYPYDLEVVKMINDLVNEEIVCFEQMCHFRCYNCIINFLYF